MPRYFRGQSGLIGLAIMGPALAIVPATAAPKLGVYCINEKPGLQVFADKLLPNGDLSFGLSVWYPNGQHIGLFGVASRRGDHWEYIKDMAAADPEDRCKVSISSRRDGTPLLVGDAMARCRPDGGVGTQIDARQFPRSAYEGPVTNELSGSEFFFSHVGRCADK